MKIKPRIIWTAGQQTALVVQEDMSNKEQISLDLLKEYPDVDQVGWLSVGSRQASAGAFTMMGGELSINGCIAAGYVLGQLTKQRCFSFATSCLTDLIKVSIDSSVVSVSFPRSLIKKRAKNVVCLQGIRYLLICGIPPTKILTTEQQYLLTEMLELDPAAGIIFYLDSKIVPVVAVKGTNSLYWEQACGSGSLAYWATSGISKIRQPSGEDLTITADSQTITITAETKEI